jgi:hypothetical protein
MYFLIHPFGQLDGMLSFSWSYYTCSFIYLFISLHRLLTLNQNCYRRFRGNTNFVFRATGTLRHGTRTKSVQFFGGLARGTNVRTKIRTSSFWVSGCAGCGAESIWICPILESDLFTIAQYLLRRRGSSVGTATDYRLDGRVVEVRVPVGSRILCSPRHQDRLWSPRNLLSNG